MWQQEEVKAGMNLLSQEGSQRKGLIEEKIYNKKKVK